MIPMQFEVFHEDVEYVVVGAYTPADPGQTSGPPERCYPPEDSEFEIEGIFTQTIPAEEISGQLQPHILGEIQRISEEKADEIFANMNLERDEP